ncbi:cytochrome b [Phenylobacterium sp.]|uniref:cytochrome b n=1 Tax=Phenylobacterium sp. TaxID=1871053 RepID=UPI0035B4F8B9
MSLTNTRQGYGWIAIGLHWISAFAVILLWFLGERMEDAPDRAAHIAARSLHISVGMLLITFLVARLIWTATQPAPDKLGAKGPLYILAKAVQGLLLLMILIQVVTGPLAVWAGARPIAVFDWFSIPSMFPAKVGWLKEGAEFLHKAAPNALWPLLILHVLGALKHAVIDRDATLTRMLWAKS